MKHFVKLIEGIALGTVMYVVAVFLNKAGVSHVGFTLWVSAFGPVVEEILKAVFGLWGTVVFAIAEMAEYMMGYGATLAGGALIEFVFARALVAVMHVTTANCTRKKGFRGLVVGCVVHITLNSLVQLGVPLWAWAAACVILVIATFVYARS